MKITVYAVGSHVSTATYSSIFAAFVTPATSIPAEKNANDFLNNKIEVISSLTSCETPQFFADKNTALEFANRNVEKHLFTDVYIKAQPVLKVKLDAKSFTLKDVVSASIPLFNKELEIDLNHEVKTPEPTFSGWWSKSKEVKCTEKNYKGDFSQLYARYNMLQFTMWNKNKLLPKELPLEIVKEIGQHVLDTKPDCVNGP